ncbi:MAG: PAS domain-containing protein [Salinarchaeum sp.]
MEAPVVLVVGAISNRVRDDLQTGATVRTVETATDAKQVIASDTPDLVLTRQALPATTGIALAETIAERWHHVPVVLVTTDGSEALASQAVTADVAAYCSYEETIDPVDLADCVEDILTSATVDTPATGIVDRMTDGFFALDASYRFTYLNERARQRFEETLGRELTPGALRGQAFEAVVDDDPTFIERFREAMDTQEPVTFEAAYAPLKQVFELRVFPSESGLSVYFRNVTERRRRETALEEERALTESVLSALPDALYVFDTEGQFLRWNETFSAVTGYDDAAIAEMVPADFIADPDVDAVEAAIARVFEDGEPITVEARFETADGAWIPHEFTGGPITDGGQITRLVGIGRDLTERKARERRFQAVFDNTYQFTGLLDPDGTVIEANETALEFGAVLNRGTARRS